MRDLLARWGIAHGMYVLGVDSAYHFLHRVREFRTGDVSDRVTQDVLLLAGSADHYVPLHQLYRQMAALTRATSITARIFTPAEHAQNHCQIGNTKLAVQVILAWLAGADVRCDPALLPVEAATSAKSASCSTG